jgi:hypothetical protein
MWVGVDLDGCLARYTHWTHRGEDYIGDPVPSMQNRVMELLAAGVEVRIFTARVCNPVTANHHRSLIENWCEKHLGKRLPVTNQKDYDLVRFYDDRARRVEVNTGRIL